MKSKILIIILLFTLLSCSNNKKENPQVDAPNKVDMSNFITAHTSGTISIKDKVLVTLNISNESYVKPDEALLKKAITYNNKMDADINLDDNGVLTITPKKQLSFNKEWQCSVELGYFFSDIKEKNKYFKFSFKTGILSFESGIDGVFAQSESNSRQQKIKAYIKTSDFVSEDKKEEMLKVELDGLRVKNNITWDHISDTESWILIQNIEKKEIEQRVELIFNGNKIGINKIEKADRVISAIGQFKYLEHSLQQRGQKVIRINFSSPIKRNQHLDSLISLSTGDKPKITVEGSTLRVYPPNNVTGKVKLGISKNLIDTNDIKLNKPYSLTINFDRSKPGVMIVGDQGILPSSDNLKFSFDAVTLKSIKVVVQEISKNNILQHLQVNNIIGTKELNRVGETILSTSIDLNLSNIDDPYSWNRFYINLADYITVNTGSMYYITLSFDIEDSIFEFMEGGDKKSDTYRSHDWKLRKDPSNNYYYKNYGFPVKMIYSSNLGIIAKKSSVNKMNLYITNILDTKPVSGAIVIAYNYQQQPINQGVTNSSGEYSFNFEELPSFIVVKNDRDTGYCKIRGANSLSTSSFDTTGVYSSKGIKGFIYGDRGVWRPGDTIYLNFILQDINNRIPNGHPIIMELWSPKGKMIKKVVKERTNATIYDFPIETSVDSSTGDWIAKVKVGGSTYSKNVKIETIKPNRLKLDLDFNQEVLTYENEQISGDLQVNWLHGAPARNLKTKYDIELFPVDTRFKGYDEFEFDDPGIVYSSKKKSIIDTKVDESGFAKVDINLNELTQSNRSPGILQAVFTGKAFEEGGNFSIDNFSKLYYPYKSYVGMKFEKSSSWYNYFYVDKEYNIDLALVDKDGNPLSSQVDIEIYKMEWKWWWHRGNQRNDAYLSANSKNLIKNDSITVKNGKAKWNFSFGEEETGRYYVKVTDRSSGHSTGSIFYMRWPYWYWYRDGVNRNNKGDEGAVLLQFASDKESYTLGEKALITFPSSKGGRALISIENGSEILKSFWVETEDKETKTTVDIVAGMAPGIYINIILLQPHSQKVNDLPIRLYGIIPVEVYDPNTKITPIIDTADSYRPEKEVNISVSELNGKPMDYTLIIVDEGLLDITNFDTPNPWSSFYAREALGVRTWDIYSFIAGAFTGNYGTLLAVGGGGMGTGKDPEKINRFKPVVQYLGPFSLKAGEKKSHSFILTPYIGSVRVMVTGANKSGAYGSIEKAVPVKDPLMVLSTMPRVLGPNEKLKLPVNVFALEDHIKEVTVTIESSELIKIVGEKTKKVFFDKIGDKTIYFDAETANDLGNANVKVTVQSGKNRAETEVDINLRASNMPETRVQSTILQPGKSWDVQFNDWALKSTKNMKLEISRIPPIDLNRRLDYLIRYPHGCLEQTLSRIFPQLFLSDITDLTAEQKSDIDNFIKIGINKLKRFQKSDGSFVYWPGRSYTNIWLTNYAGHFLLEAEKRGYSIPGEMKRTWISYQNRAAKSYDYYENSRHLNQSYRLYTLALAGQGSISIMNRLYSNKDSLNSLDKSRLASAYALSGRMDVAKELIKESNWRSLKDYKPTRYSYGSKLRDKAMMLEAMVHTDSLGENSAKLLESISAELSNSNRWMSTQTTAYSLIAVGYFSNKANKGDNITYSYSSENGKNKVDFTKNISTQNIPFTNKITVTNHSKIPLYTRAISSGIPLVGRESDEENGISMSVKYVIPNRYNVENIPQGTDFYAEVTVTNNTSDYIEDLSLNMIFPSGWEILNTRLYDSPENRNKSKINIPDYTDIKDDRVYMYFDLSSNRYQNDSISKTFKVLLNASYIGEYYLPGISCEAMYDNEIYSRKKGKKVKVTAQQTGA